MIKQFRFSKAITTICIVMNILITVSIILLWWRGHEIDSGVCMALYSPFSIELGLNALIKSLERGKKNE